MEELKEPAVPDDTVNLDSLEASVRQLNEEFEVFRQGYSCDIDKLTGLLLEVKSALNRKRNAGLWQRLRIAVLRH